MKDNLGESILVSQDGKCGCSTRKRKGETLVEHLLSDKFLDAGLIWTLKVVDLDTEGTRRTRSVRLADRSRGNARYFFCILSLNL